MTTETMDRPAGEQPLSDANLPARTPRPLAALSSSGGGIVFQTVSEARDVAFLMAGSDKAVRKHLRNNAGACFGIVIQAVEWGMSPYAVANKSYEVNDQIANLLTAQLLYLDSENHNPIMLYLNSPGGIVYGGFAIYDTMRKLKSPVATVAMGFCGSMSTFLLTAGQNGQRYALPHATIHMHPTGGGAKGYTEDVRIAYKEQERLQNQIFHLMGKFSV